MSKPLKYRYNSFGDLACVIEYVMKTCRKDLFEDIPADELRWLVTAICEAIVSPVLIDERTGGHYL